MKKLKIFGLLVMVWVIAMEVYRAARPWDRSQPDLADALPPTELVQTEIEGFELGVAFHKGLMTQQEVIAAIGTNLVIGYGDAWQEEISSTNHPPATSDRQKAYNKTNTP